MIASTRPSALDMFRNRSFALLWGGQFISAVGSSFTMLASSILVYRLTGSAMSVALMLMCGAIPALFVGLVAGVLVDRYDRRRIMVAADCVRAAFILLIPFLVPVHIAWLYVLTMLSATATQFFEPAHASLLPELATDEELAAANSMLAVSSLGSIAIGFAAAGLIASRFPIEWAFYLDSLSFLLSAGCILLIRSPQFRGEGGTNVSAVAQNLRAGLSYVATRAILRSLFLIFVPVFLSVGLFNALALPFAERALNAGESQFGLLLAAEAVGYLLGGLALAQLSDRLRESQWLTLSLGLMGILTLAYAGVAYFGVALALMLVSGFANMPAVIARQLLIQRHTTREIRGRVFSAFFVMRDLLFVGGMALAGLADVLPIRPLYAASALLLLLPAVAVLVLPGLRQPAMEWLRVLALLRGARSAPGLPPARPATVADLDQLARWQPAIHKLAAAERAGLAAMIQVAQTPAGTPILRRGDTADASYFIMAGRVVAGLDEEGDCRCEEVLNEGDFFGEVGILLGGPNMVNVMAEADATLLRVPSAALHQIMGLPELRELFLRKAYERINCMNRADLPGYASLGQGVFGELRTSLHQT